MKNKKGISAVVATVLIILITVAAVTIIWAAIIPMIQEQIGGSTECFDAQAAITVSSDYTCFNSTGIKVQVHRGVGDYELLGLEIFTATQGTSNSTRIAEANVPDSNGERVYYIINNTDVDEVAVAAVVGTGSAEKICTKGSMVPIRPCA